MRILMLAQFYPPAIGGEERLVADLSIELAARGHDVSVVTLRHKGFSQFEIDRGVRIHRVRGTMQRLGMLFSESDRQSAPPFPDPEVLWALRRIILQERPDIQAAARDVDASMERIALENARSKPDISPFVGYKRVALDNSVLFGVNVPLRIRDKNQAGIARAEADAKTALLDRLPKQGPLASVPCTTLVGHGIPAVTLTTGGDRPPRTIALAAYEEGGTDLLPLLDAQRTRVEVRQQYFKTLLDYRASLIDLELAVGREIQP